MQLGRYANGNKAILLIDDVDSSPVAYATDNVNDVELADNEVMIKDYSEIKGMLDALQDSKVVERVVDVVQSGYVDIPVVTINPELVKNFEEV